MKEKIKELIEAKHKSSGGNCGLTFVKIKLQLGFEYKDTLSIVEELIKEDFVEIRDGGQGELIMLKVKNK